MAAGCRIPECTFAETGACLENNPPDSCPNRIKVEDVAEPISSDGTVPPPLSAPVGKPRFPSSLTLGMAEASGLMCQRYCRLIGILGAPDAGKTASMASLFLLLGREKLSGFRLADSRTIMALNEISQGARRWNQGSPPEQMTSHTELGPNRGAGFLHLRLKRAADNQVFDFLLPDLPGEWSDSFIDRNRYDRLNFLKAADTIWLMADGRGLSNPETRLTVLRRLDLLMSRVAALVGRSVPVLLVLSHRDSGEAAARNTETLRSSATAKGIDLDIVSIASFRRKGGETAAGFGVSELIAKTIGAPPARPAFWPDSDQSAEHRQLLRFGDRGAGNE